MERKQRHSHPTSLMRKTLTQFSLCLTVLLLLATPLFYWLTKNFYAEDMLDLIEAIRRGAPMPDLDLEADIMQGVMLQFAVIAVILAVAIVLTARLISRRLWQPFDRTLEAIEQFSLERGVAPALGESDIEEFARLNATLQRLMDNNLRAYRTQKEFTENASHELQTPLAVFQSKLDLLTQQPDLSEQQALILQQLYDTVGRLSRLNRNLLLLAKIENKQYGPRETVDLVALTDSLRPSLDAMADGRSIDVERQTDRLALEANRTLVESMVTNLVVNALRHSPRGGHVRITVAPRRFSVTNTANGPALDSDRIFCRFYRSGNTTASGAGLGLAIVKSVCDYHGWNVAYTYEAGLHIFAIDF